jgi:hypothetical protein
MVLVAVGTVALLPPDRSTPTSAQHLTAPPPTATVPLTDQDVLALLSRTPVLGVLGDPRRRSSCLNGLGYAGAATVLGGQQVDMNGERAVVLVLAGDEPGSIVALVVRTNCSSVDTGLLAYTEIRRP